ncbi:MAG: ATP-binding cassette domain-containing protein [Deltaproteobacteria bacterium]|nr:ATP-binding cassette domain-containing protein [Deltaproteobacteria bacterium]
MEETPLIEFKDVTKRFSERTILNRINLRIYEGQVTTIIGKSGTGKSVLLKHIIGLLKPDEGTILFRGKPIGKMTKPEWNEYTGQISYMFQNNALFDSMTVFENLAFPLRQTTTLSRKTIEERVMTRIAQIELSEVAHRYPSELSGGMQKRVALGRVLVTDPKIVLFDEPATGQDMIRRNAILGMIAEYQKKFGFTAVLISHDIPDVLFISNRLLILDRGKIVFQDSPDELDRIDLPFVKEFIESLEGFQEHLTGLKSKRAFKVRYQTALSQKHPHDTFVVATFTLGDLDRVEQNLGHETAQEIIKALGNYINSHFGAVGGFSTRQSKDHFVTVLPFSDIEEAGGIIQNFSQDLQEEGIGDIQREADLPDGKWFEFAVLGGVAEGKTGDRLNVVVASAQSREKIIGQFQCETRRLYWVHERKTWQSFHIRR